MQTAIAFALIRLGKISGRRRPGTGPAPIAKVKTNLNREVRSYGTHNDIVNQNDLFIICKPSLAFYISKLMVGSYFLVASIMNL